MLDIIINNPYRIVGVFATSTKKDIVAHVARIKANTRVNRVVTFASDLSEILPNLVRTKESVADAEAKLTLPQDSIQYAQFWPIELTEIDKIALKYLNVGNVDKAMSTWSGKEDISSIHNQIFVYLTNCNYSKALELASLFYDKYTDEFVHLVLNDNNQRVDKAHLAFSFLDILCDGISAEKVSMYITKQPWREYVSQKIVNQLIGDIDNSIYVSKESMGSKGNARLKAGTKLMRDTLSPLRRLRNESSLTNHKYQMVADNLGLDILQCSIDYYNNSDDNDAAYKAMKLQKYAQSIVVGKMAKDRCNENITILEKIIRNLPPIEVRSIDKVIKAALSHYEQQPNLIKHSITLIKTCAPHIVVLKDILGPNHQYYLKISTRIVDEALYNIILEINAAHEINFVELKSTLIEAWRAQLYMDKFDLDPEYKNGHFKQCRDSLYDIINKSKGFTSSSMSYLFQHGCGWCNNIDVSDIDLRTDEELYSSCTSIVLYENYLKKFPTGKHIQEAKAQIEILTFKKALTIRALQSFIQQYPNSQYVSQAIDKIMELRFKECKTIEDYRKFLKDYPNSRLQTIAYDTIDKIVQKEKESKIRIERQDKSIRNIRIWNLGMSIVPLILILMHSTWGVPGSIIIATMIAIIFGTIALSSIKNNNSFRSRIFLIYIPITTIVFVVSVLVLSVWANQNEKENESKEVYEQILNDSSINSCKEYILRYPNVDNADKVRNLWLNLLIDKAREFDYESYRADFLGENKTPINELEDYIESNKSSSYYAKAQSFMQSICDSLYQVADNASTQSAWTQYQNVVPSYYLKDSDAKINEIENMSWDTEAKAWQQVLSQNNISACNKYISLYPQGSHISICEKKLIDLEVSQIYDSDHGTLPEMDRTEYGGGPTSYIAVTNNTSYTLTLLYSGPDSKRLVITNGETSFIQLKNGSYKVAASVSASNVSHYAGNEQLQGGNYSVDYYISTYRY